MNDFSINLYAYFDNKEKFVYDYEIYDCYVIFVVEKGVFQCVDQNENILTAKAGEVIYCPKGFLFKRKVVEPVSLHMIRYNWGEMEYGCLKKYFINERMNEDLKKLKVYYVNSGILNHKIIHYCSDFVFEMC